MKLIHLAFIAVGIFLAVFVITLLIAPVATSSSGGANVAVIPISGAITIGGSQDFFSATSASATDIVYAIEQANQARGIRIIVLEVNSPGGSAVASEEIVRAVERADKPVVAWVRESGASGAYWIASQSDHIIANPMSITGSVGVIASYLEFGDFLKEYNITYQQLIAGENKDVGNPFSELTEDQRATLQAQLDRIHEYFLDDVATARNLTSEQREIVGTGMFFLGVEAYDLGLVDELGGRYELESYLEEQLGTEPRFRRYEKEKGFFEQLAGVSRPGIPFGIHIKS